MSSSGKDVDLFLPLSLHDALALGDVEVGLLAEKREKSEMEEIERLPLLLRILSAARPLATIPTFDEETPTGDSTTGDSIDEIANQVVAHLEDVAATHSIAEGVDVVACHLAPAICRNLSKLSPLKRKRSSIAGGTKSEAHNPIGWDTSELVVVGANPRSSFKRRRMSSKALLAGKQDTDDIAFSEGVSSDDEGQKGTTLETRRLSRRISAELREAGAEDSQEEVVSKTLSELSALVASSLEPAKVDTDGENRNGKLALASEDSIFSELVRGHTGGARGVMTGSDLGSTLAALMHHAPVLRHQHVANALCRATVPQAAGLVKRMGANCPSAVPSLLRGCLDAYKSATSVGFCRHSGIANMATAAIKELAALSAREKSRVRTILQQYGVLIDLQLQLAMGQDPMSALCLILEHLSSEPTDRQQHASAQGKDTPDEIMSNDSAKETSSEMGEMSLQVLLQENGDFLGSTLTFLRNELSSSIEASNITGECGRLCLLLRCYAWLVLQCDFTLALQTSENGIQAMQQFLVVLQSALAKMREQAEVSSGSNWVEGPLELLFCGTMLTLGRLLAMDKSGQPVVDLCGSLVGGCLDCRSKHTKYCTLVARFTFVFQQKDAGSFHELLSTLLNLELCSGKISIPNASKLQVCVSKVGNWLSSGYDVDTVLKDGLSSRSPAVLSLLLDTMKCSHGDLMDAKNSVRTCLADLLCEMDPGAILEEDNRAPEYIVRATRFLAVDNGINLPVVSPLQLESDAGKADLCRFDGHASSGGGRHEIRLLLQVLYWFAYIDSGTDSLFTFDVRGLPLKEITNFSHQKSKDSLAMSQLSFYLFNLFTKLCPEIPKKCKQWELSNHSTIDLRGSHKDAKATVRRTLAKVLRTAASSNSADPSGVLAERTFLFARSQLSDSDLCSQVASALLSTPNSPPPFITYSMLCNDPLVLLKAPMRVWQCLGLRRIMLSILTPLLETNEAVLDRTSLSTTGANELISCRNVLIARSILVVVSGSDESRSEHPPFVCSMTTNFLRKLIAKNPGLVGMIVKQSPALPDCATDWLVEFVPETMDDSGSLLNVLSGSASVTSRLTASASILRIAIAHGHRDETGTQQIVYAALAQLVSSFFLVIGPVGVPVNVLIGDGSGQDVTQTSRKAIFRMLRSLVNVRGRMRPRMRSECGLALHKLAGLCKGENLLIGVTGAVLARRKGLLREMFEAVNKAANAMGSGMEL